MALIFLLYYAACSSLIFGSAVFSQTVCKGSDRDPCKCDLVSGKGVIDLQAVIKDQSKIPFFQGIPDTSDGDFYYYNPCKPFISSTSDGETLDDLAVMVSSSSDNSSIGDQSSAVFTVIDGEVNINYTHTDYGVSSTSTVKLVCQQSGSDELTSSYTADYNTYLFTLEGPGACPSSSSSSGLSGGSIFLILFFVILLLYLVIGMVYQKKKNNATGSDIIPNKDFWSSLPGLIKDGFMYIVFKCKGKPSSVYENI